jgi:hypothetical protein
MYRSYQSNQQYHLDNYDEQGAFNKTRFYDQGVEFEKHVGLEYENKGYLVIYNGIISGYSDRGVDLIFISPFKNKVSLAQCKHWNSKVLKEGDLESIYQKLSDFNLELYNLNLIETHKLLQIPIDQSVVKSKINSIVNNIESSEIIIEKSLYVTKKMIDIRPCEISKMLKRIDNHTYSYKDMGTVKIVSQIPFCRLVAFN